MLHNNNLSITLYNNTTLLIIQLQSYEWQYNNNNNS